MLSALQNLWAQMGDAGHFLVYNAGLSMLAVLAGMIPGSFGSLLKSVVDYFSANLQHPQSQPPASPPPAPPVPPA